MVYNNLNGPEVSKFKKDTLKDFNYIKSIKVLRSPPALRFRYSFKQKIDEKEMYRIFYKTREFVEGKDFKREHFKGIEGETTSADGSDIVFPKVYIDLDFNNDNNFDYQFYTTVPLKPGGENDKQNKNEALKWFYWDGKGESKQIK